MAKSSKKSKSIGGAGDNGEVQVQKSPAEFFAENQAIAGFDNLGKSLYTSLREFVENALDACESIGELPSISCSVVEYTQKEFNALADIGSSPRKAVVDNELFETKKQKKSRKSDASASGATAKAEKNDAQDKDDENSKKKGRSSQEAYFLLTVKDNGCGMKHTAIPDLLGRVLSGSKYGVRQTRGKFGLGAKMALIWSKKSTGQPIRVTTSHRPNGGEESGTHISDCVLDIDIYKNEPRILEHSKRPNNENWVGTQVQVLIAGNWTTYKSRIVQYLQQLAIITPYAVLELNYQNQSDPKRNMNIRYDRRSEQMPQPAKEVKHHPSSVNNLVIQNLIRLTRCKTLLKFLSTDLSSVSPALAKRLIAELGGTFDESMAPQDIDDKQITRMVQLLRRVQLFKAPDGSCLSPLGEYNLNLGILKVVEPDLVATARDKASAYDGHPFQVEAAVSLGGRNVKEGITVVRFANRIPLLFEAGGDVATRVAQTKIRWSTYKIDHKKDKVGVYVSIVSTKVPFKGTSKEYIGDDATEISLSVKRALQSCCQQLRAHLLKRNAIKDAAQRKNRLRKHVPDVGRSLYGILEQMRKRHIDTPILTATGISSPTKRLRVDKNAARDMALKLDRGIITEKRIEEYLMEAIDDDEEDTSLNDKGSSGANRKSLGNDSASVPIPMFLVPLYNLEEAQYDVVNPSLFRFRPIQPIQQS